MCVLSWQGPCLPHSGCTVSMPTAVAQGSQACLLLDDWLSMFCFLTYLLGFSPFWVLYWTLSTCLPALDFFSGALNLMTTKLWSWICTETLPHPAEVVYMSLTWAGGTSKFQELVATPRCSWPIHPLHILLLVNHSYGLLESSYNHNRKRQHLSLFHQRAYDIFWHHHSPEGSAICVPANWLPQTISIM